MSRGKQSPKHLLVVGCPVLAALLLSPLIAGVNSNPHTSTPLLPSWEYATIISPHSIRLHVEWWNVYAANSRQLSPPTRQENIEPNTFPFSYSAYARLSRLTCVAHKLNWCKSALFVSLAASSYLRLPMDLRTPSLMWVTSVAFSNKSVPASSTEQ